MGSRWLSTGDRSRHATAAREPSIPAPAAAGSWIAWLITGAGRVPIDSRRARGADDHLKGVLIGRHGVAVAQVTQAGMVAAAAAAAAALLATQRTPAGHVSHPNKAPRVAATGSAVSVQSPAHTGATAVARLPSWPPVADTLPHLASPLKAVVPGL